MPQMFFILLGPVCTQLEEVYLVALLGSNGSVVIGCPLTVLSGLFFELPNVQIKLQGVKTHFKW